MPPAVILYDISHTNLLLLAAAIPPFDAGDTKEGSATSTEDLDWGGKLDYDNPDNFTDTTATRQRI